MSDLKKIAALFILCLILAVYTKLSGMAPVQIGTGTDGQNNILGANSSRPSFANLVPK